MEERYEEDISDFCLEDYIEQDEEKSCCGSFCLDCLGMSERDFF
jgi:hypothetical protein